ncbi:MAG TPA: hypothetical protein VH350_10450 [Candidatus Sulfotelmatobacter sp.]|jgi:hypothetical protein|nr:hypothetical protein [Candidatus Sulfotelmatobacter sp.]
MGNRIVVCLSILICSVAWGQAPAAPSSAAQQGEPQSMPGMDMSGHDMSKMKDMPMAADKDADSEASAHVMNSMEGHMDMGPHMKMTALRPPKPGDTARAQRIAEEARKASEKYTDYHTALADGFKIFHPEIPQKVYHFTNYGYAIEAAFRFNPEHPTSLLYEKHGEDYKLIGVMYTAPKRFTEDQLDERIPLSVAQWHEHVNFCMAPAGRRKEMMEPHPQFGLRGSITTQEACDAAGGTFHPVVFNWMVHIYPFEKDQANIWSVERQHGDAD